MSRASDDGAETDAFLHQDVDDQDDDGHGRHRQPVVQGRVRGDAHAQAVPGRQADVREDRQVDAEGEHGEARGDPEPFRKDLPDLHIRPPSRASGAIFPRCGRGGG